MRDVDLSGYDAVWASPPCQFWSDQNHGTADESTADLLAWSLELPHDILWVENIISRYRKWSWGIHYNAAQFTEIPVQRRRRMVGGCFIEPSIWREYKDDYLEWAQIAPPACLASELKQGGRARTWKKERRKFTRWYWYKMGRMPTVEDMAKAQGFDIPAAWHSEPIKLQSHAIGNGVPVYMARAFGEAYTRTKHGVHQFSLFEIED